MKIIDTKLSGVSLVELEPIVDERGSFARSFCVDEFRKAGIKFEIHQANISVNNFAGTVRGMHFQNHPSPEAKIVRCTRGAIFDVVLDLRPESATCCQWFGIELSPVTGTALLIPPGCAHGFQSLVDNSEVHYLMCGGYDATAATGVRYDDPTFRIDWPLPVTSVSARDRGWPDYEPQSTIKSDNEL